MRTTIGTLVVGVVACASPAPKPAPPIANVVAPSPPPRSPCDFATELAWLGTTEHLLVTEVSDGHFGSFEFHATLRGPPDEPDFAGVMSGTYRYRDDTQPIAVAAS